LREQRLDDAKRFYRRALQLNREDADAQAAMGLWELAAKRPDRARQRLKRAERLDPEAERVELLRTRLALAGEALAATLDDAT
jgi:Tfp pilus assembly protein PilF